MANGFAHKAARGGIFVHDLDGYSILKVLGFRTILECIKGNVGLEDDRGYVFIQNGCPVLVVLKG